MQQISRAEQNKIVDDIIKEAGKYDTGPNGIDVMKFIELFNKKQTDPTGYYAYREIPRSPDTVFYSKTESNAKSLKHSYKIKKIGKDKEVIAYIKRTRGYLFK